MNDFGPPYTDVRIEPPDISVFDLRQLSGLVRIDLQPPASGPEVELTFATAAGAEPAPEAFIRHEVERFTGRTVLASRQRGEDPQKVIADLKYDRDFWKGEAYRARQGRPPA